MKPNFALSLSFDGISLFQRIQGGWSCVNEIALDTTSMGSDMADLRQQADALAPDGGMVKLVLPNEQIKYLSIMDPSADDATRVAAVEAALDGATPYAVQDLAYDWVPVNGQLKIAAVALETLAEAEGFAQSHHFEPVSFVANADEGAFDGEVFFGAAESWIAKGGPTPVRDSAAMTIVAPGVAQDPEPPQAVVAKADPAVQQPDVAPVEPDLQSPDVPVDAPIDSGASGAGETDPVPAPEPEAPAPSFSSIRAARSGAPDALKSPAVSPKLDGAQRDTVARPDPAPRLRLSAQPKPASGDVPAPKAFQSKPETKPRVRDVAGVTAPDLPKDPKKRKPKPKAKDRPSIGALFGSRRKTTEAPTRAAAKATPKVQAKVSAKVQAKTNAVQPVPPAVAARLAQVQAADPTETGTRATVAGALSPSPQPVAAEAVAAPMDERQRMTIFGSREAQAARIGGKPKFLGLILTTTLLLVLAGVAAWASVYLDEGLARFFPAPAEEQTAEGIPQVPDIEAETAEIAPGVEVASLDPGVDTTLTNDVEPALAVPLQPDPISEEEAAATYAATGIWPMSPVAPSVPIAESVAGLYEASIDPLVEQVDAVALPSVAALLPDSAIAKQPSPAAHGTLFDLDDRGLVRATLEGAVNPDGVVVYAGLPPVVPPLRDRAANPSSVEIDQALVIARLSQVRPRLRPGALLESSERAQLQGLSREELGRLRPLARPISETEQVDEASLLATKLAVGSSLKPITRPKNFAAIVEQAEDTRVAALQAPVQPKIPTTASVAKQATVENALKLNRVNLIGVYGKPESRRALVRLANGRYKKVQIGDTLDGGKVAAIGEGQLRYVKGGRNLVIEMPQG